MITWGKTIKKYRQKLTLTQEALAFAVGVTPTYISAIEHNRKQPSFDLIHAISRAFRLPQEILYWDAITFPSHTKVTYKNEIRLAKALTRTVYNQLTPHSSH